LSAYPTRSAHRAKETKMFGGLGMGEMILIFLVVLIVRPTGLLGRTT